MSDDKKTEITKEPKEKKAWTESSLESLPIVDTTAGSKRRWRYEKRFRNFEVRNRHAS